jgi:hypothetical protein
MKEDKDDKTIAAAMSHHKELHALALKNGKVKNGAIDKAWLAKMSKGEGVNAARARLSMTLNEIKEVSSDQSDKGA